MAKALNPARTPSRKQAQQQQRDGQDLIAPMDPLKLNPLVPDLKLPVGNSPESVAFKEFKDSDPTLSQHGKHAQAQHRLDKKRNLIKSRAPHNLGRTESHRK